MSYFDDIELLDEQILALATDIGLNHIRGLVGASDAATDDLIDAYEDGYLAGHASAKADYEAEIEQALKDFNDAEEAVFEYLDADLVDLVEDYRWEKAMRSVPEWLDDDDGWDFFPEN